MCTNTYPGDGAVVYPGEAGLLVQVPVAAYEVAVACLVAACVGIVACVGVAAFACEGAVACFVAVACEGVVAAPACEAVAVVGIVAVGTAAADIAAGGNPVVSRASVVGTALAVEGTALVDPLASAGLTYPAYPCCNYL